MELTTNGPTTAPKPVERSLLQIQCRKRDGKELSKEEVVQIVKAITDGTLEDLQLGAFLMSIFLNGLNKEETAYFTEAMKNSGFVFSWPSSWKVGDKHSTGGVGDKVSLALTPALAVNGLKVPMISGRGLGHTGGTLDKLESIPGFRVQLTTDEITSALEQVGCCIVGQTPAIVPADGRMYAARDTTGTVAQPALIVSSIISKKACEGLQGLVMDVKHGSGSMDKPFEETVQLAHDLVEASSSLGIATTALISCNEDPIGRTIGNALELREAIEVLRGEGPDDLVDLVVQLGGELLYCCKLCSSPTAGKELIAKSLNNSSALKKFSEMIQFQNVSKEIAEKLCGTTPDWSVLPKANYVKEIQAQQSGLIQKINALEVALLCRELGAGRRRSSDRINYAVGVVLKKTVGDEVTRGDVWCEVHHDFDEGLPPHLTKAAESFITVKCAEESVEKGKPRGSRVLKRISSIQESEQQD